MKEGREGATEGRTWGKKLELCYSPWKSTQLLRASVVLPVKQEWWKYDFLTDTLIVDLSVPCEVYNMMQSMAFYLASFAIISPIYAFCAINIHLIKTGQLQKVDPCIVTTFFGLEALLTFLTQKTNSQFLTAFVCHKLRKLTVCSHDLSPAKSLFKQGSLF